MKRLIAILLAVVLSIGLLPSFAAAQGGGNDETPYELRHPKAIEVWKTIERAETEAVAEKGSYSDAAEAAYAIVAASDTTEAGSLERHGEAFFWRTVDGAACGYNPVFRARVRKTATGADMKPEATEKGGVAASADVAVFQPYIGLDSSFTSQYADEGGSIAEALGGACTVYKTNDATVDNIAHALETCAVVIFDSHGDTDYASGDDCVSRANTSYICLQSGSGLTQEDQKTVAGRFGSYYHAYYGGSYGRMQYYMVDGTAIANHMTGEAPRSLLWMAICLGMATDGMHKPLREKGVQTVYGYSQSVSFTGDYAYEESFFYALKQGATVTSAIAMMKRENGNWDPAYKSYTESMAVKRYVAFPIVVSDEDAYPGQGNVDAVQTVTGKGQIKEADFLYGDVNGDGRVSVTDASLLLRYVVKKETLTRDQLLRADVNANRAVDSMDASAILRRIVELIPSFDAEP